MTIKAIDIINASSNAGDFAELLNDKAYVEVVAGKEVDASSDIKRATEEVIAILAIVSATGAPATKFLLDVTTDYVVSGKKITFKSDQSANKVIVVYK